MQGLQFCIDMVVKELIEKKTHRLNIDKCTTTKRKDKTHEQRFHVVHGQIVLKDHVIVIKRKWFNISVQWIICDCVCISFQFIQLS